jgi:hypothetical protein
LGGVGTLMPVASDLVRTLMRALAEAFAANADVDKAVGARAYMRDHTQGDRLGAS